MAGKLISIVNRKGGVGKTTMAIALCDTIISEKNTDVVLVDLDPQASASEALCKADFESRSENNGNLVGFLEEARSTQFESVPPIYLSPFETRIRGRMDRNFVVVPTSDKYWDVEDEFEANAVAQGLRRLIDLLRSKYEFVIVDCAPGQMKSTKEVLRLSDRVLVPVVPEFLARYGMERMKKYLEEIGVVGHFVVSIRDRTKSVHNRILDELQNEPFMLKASPEGGGVGREGEGIVIIDRSSKFVARPEVRQPKTFQQLYGNNGATQLRRLLRSVL